MPKPNAYYSADFFEELEELDSASLLDATIKHADMTDPDTADLEMLSEEASAAHTAGRPDDPTKRHRGFGISDETRALVLSETAFDRMKRVMKEAEDAGVEIYKRISVPVRVYTDDLPCDAARRHEAPYETHHMQTYRFLDMQEYIRMLSHKPGSVASDAVHTLVVVYRDGWATAVHKKYGAETESQRERRAAGGATLPVDWKEQTHIYDAFSKEPDIALQLSIPELRWLRSNQVQREAALSQVRWAIHCLFWAAYETRKVNVGFDWENGARADIRVPLDAEQHWDDAVVALHLYMRMLTRFVDANERQLVIKAVVWEIYWNEHHKPVIEYLELVTNSTEEQSTLRDFLKVFNACELAGIKDKAAHAWRKARCHFLGGGAVRGFDSNYAQSSNAIGTFTAWLRRRAVRAKARADVGRVLDEIPEDTRNDLAQDMYEVESWEELDDAQREQLTRDWAKGQESFREWVASMATRDATEAARQEEIDTAAANSAQQRAMLAFPKPDVLEAFATAEYQEHNPDHQKKLKAAEERKRARKLVNAGTTGKANTPSKRQRPAAAASSSSAGAAPARKPVSFSDTSDDDDDLPPARKTHKIRGHVSDSSDEE